ncbi:MAG: undecaprenyl/decaprenyl-phosphate alpha-N-acetylglucosaminyl 1-phosphate transferase [Burkholderiaceae bacterium]|nr:undecaprenyl/decaprenyl-phosphate alpha-N-acetylglucosaminyl 1-phosphate transferase [Microbacteriaceae bacterium]
MSLTYYVLAAGIAAVITFTLAIVILKLSLRFRLYPKIRDRDVHTRPTPRLGGIAMFIGIVTALWVASQVTQFALVFTRPGPVIGIVVASLIIVLIGVADDVWDLDWMTKLAGQMIAAGILVWQGVQLVTLPIGGVTVVPPVLGLILTVIAVVLVMNAVNFIDGLDGLVTGVVLIANTVFFIYSYILTTKINPSEYFNLASLISAVLIGACVGFLPLNWHPAKMFMGDAGALLVGLLMAASAVSVTGQVDTSVAISGRQLLPAFIPILLPLAVLVVPLLDFGLAVFRRLRAGKSPFSADRKHLHHRLLDMGHSHFHAVLIFYAWTTVVSVGFLSFLFIPPWWSVAVIALGLIVCAWVTLAPLTKRQVVESAVQRASASQAHEANAERYDPLDEASTDPLGSDSPEGDEVAEAVLDALARKDTA